MTSTSDQPRARRGRSLPPDRLTAVLDEVERARTGGWTPNEPTDRGRRRETHRSGSDSSGPRHLRRRPTDSVRPHTPLVRPPSSLRDAVVAPGRLAAVAVLVLVVAAGLVLGGRVLWLRATASPHPVDPAAAGATSVPQGTPRANPAAPERSSSSSRQAARASATSIMVHVVGQVQRPGVVTLRSGARVRDALSAAGGARTSADLGRLNLARPVLDGEQVMVPKPGEDVTTAPGQPAGAGAAPGDGGGSSSGAGSGTDAPVDLNQADESALEELPGVGPVIAGRIVQWRQENGTFSSVDELGEVSGIGEKMLAQLRPLVTV